MQPDLELMSRLCDPCLLLEEAEQDGWGEVWTGDAEPEGEGGERLSLALRDEPQDAQNSVISRENVT